jgi:IS5 family transposase
MRFLNLAISDDVPDSKTIWNFREQLTSLGLVEGLFEAFLEQLEALGLVVNQGKIIDASFVEVPKQRNNREDNKKIKSGEVPEHWKGQPHKRSQKDTDAKWTKKNFQNYYGYKNHVNVDRRHKLVRRYLVSDAAQHDSQPVDHLLMRGNTGSGVWADSAYRSEEMENKLRERKLKSHIHRKGKRGKPLTEQAKGSNRTKSSVRVRVEHVFGAQTNDMGGTLVRTIGIVRAKAKIGMKNLAYNMRRLVQLRRINPNPA